MSRLFLLTVVAVLWCPSSQALTINGYDADKHQRFNNDPSFIGNPHNWSGISRFLNTTETGMATVQTSNSRATMVSDRFFLSANHAHPPVSQLNTERTLTFFHSNDPSGVSETHEVTAGWRIGGTDLWLGQLGSPVSASVEKYSVLAANPTNVIGTEVYVFGAGQRLGRNVVDDFLDDFAGPASATGDAFLYDYDTGMAGLGDDESIVQGGDSGSPVFAITPQGPALLGIHWFLYVDDMDPTMTGSGDSFIPSYISEINAIMSPFGESLSIVAVPEPSGILFLAGSLAMMAGTRRRRRRGLSMVVAARARKPAFSASH